jgi:hypothetical protein
MSAPVPPEMSPHSDVALAFGAPAFVIGTLASFFVDGTHAWMLGVFAAVGTVLVAIPFWRVVMKRRVGRRRGAIAGALIGTLCHPAMIFLLLSYEGLQGVVEFEHWTEPLSSAFYFGAFSIVYTAGATIFVGALIGLVLTTRLQRFAANEAAQISE